MKKKCSIIKVCALFAAAAVIAFAAAFVIFRQKPSQAQLIVLPKAQDKMEIDVKWLWDERALSVTQVLTLSKVPKTQIVLSSRAGAYALEETAPAPESAYPNGFSAGGLRLMGVFQDDELTDASLDETGVFLTVPISADAGQPVMLTIRYLLTAPDCADYFGTSDGVTRLFDVFFEPCVYENGVFRLDTPVSVGRSAHQSAYQLSMRLSLPDEMTPCASVSLKKQDGLWVGTCDYARDLWLILTQNAEFSEGKIGQMTVSASGEHKAQALSIAKKILPAASALYGALPEGTLRIVEAPVSSLTISAPGVVLVDPSVLSKTDAEVRLGCALLAQWFGGVSASDSYMQPWQSEAAALYGYLQCVLKTDGRDAYERLTALLVDAPMREFTLTVTPGSPLDLYDSAEGLWTVAGGQGAELLICMDQMSGGKTNDFLRCLCLEHPGEFLSRTQFETLFDQQTKLDISPLALDLLDTARY